MYQRGNLEEENAFWAWAAISLVYKCHVFLIHVSADKSESGHKICSRDCTSGEVFKILIIAQDEDVKKKFKKSKKKGKKFLQVIWEKRGFSCGPIPCCCHADLFHPGMLERAPLEGHCFPQVFSSAAAEGNAGISLPSSSEPWISPTTPEGGLWFLPTLAMGQEEILPSAPMDVQVFSDWFQKNWNALKTFHWFVFCWNFSQIQSALEKSPSKEKSERSQRVLK